MTELKHYREENRPYRSEALSPSGPPMTMADLPSTDTTRWVPRRKAEVVAGVRCGLITLEEACRMYHLSIDEFRSWERLLERHGVRGLRTTRIKSYRNT
ncbi:MAG: DUF1153 domain-containing protein [Rhodospirillales bacterium]